jgi:hypothetical protein
MVGDLDTLESYPWCGHRELLGIGTRSLITKDEVLPLFSSRRKKSRSKYCQFIGDGIDSGATLKLSRGGKQTSLELDSGLDFSDLFDDRILGGGDFVEQILSATGHAPSEQERSLPDLINQVADHLHVERTKLSQPSKERHLVRAKALICYVAIRQWGLKGVDVAAALAYTPAAVSHAAKRGAGLLSKEKDLYVLLNPERKM